MLRASSWLLLVCSALLVVPGCRCVPTTVENKPGEIAIVYSVDGVSMTSSNTGTYDFGQVPMGRKVSSKIEIRNAGGGALFLDTLTKASGEAVKIGDASALNPVFIVGFAPREIGPGETAQLDLDFDSPTDPAQNSVPHEATLTLRASNTELGKESATIVLKGVSVSGECELPDTLDFGAVARGDNYPLSVKLKNTRPTDGFAFVGDVTSNSGDDKVFIFTPESPKGEVGLKVAQEKVVTLVFGPTEVKEYVARVTMRRLDGCPEKTIKLIGTGVDTVLTWAPNPLDLGYVAPLQQTTAEMTFSNLGLKDVTLTNLRTDKADFKVLTPAPVVVKAGVRDAMGALVASSTKLKVAFKPTLLGPRPGRLDFDTDLPKQASGIQLLKGYGGGPDIDVKPPLLNFGRVAYFAGASPAAYVTRKLVIQNVGTRPTPPDAKANLHLGANGNGLVYWDVRVKPNVAGNTATLAEICVGELLGTTCTNKPTSGAYDPLVGIEAAGLKALLEVPVRVTPADSVNGGLKEWEVVIHSDDADEPDFIVTIRATSIVLPPCDYEITPTTLSFGLVTPPDYKDLSFQIRNRGQLPGDLCLISSLDLKIGSDPIFSLPQGAVFDEELQPGATRTVIVRGWPQGVVPATLTNVMGTVAFSISNPAKPEGLVALSATIGTSCLTISPDDLNFGTVKKDCNSATRSFTVYNTCPNAVKIESFAMVAPAGEPGGSTNCPGATACPEFIPVDTSGIAPMTMVQPGATPVTFSLKYRPLNLGTDYGVFLIKVTQNAQVVDYLVTLTGTGDTQGLNTDTFTQDTKPKADILLVIDNSCSMSDKQQALSVNFASFIKYANTAQVDYQIAVTTTDMVVEGGRIVGDANNPKVLKPTTPDVELKFKQKVSLGTLGSGAEQDLLPAVAALTAPLITSDNAGLLRADAVLAVVAITDADDQSPQPVSYYVNQLLSVKGVQRATMFSFNAVGPYLPSEPPGCSYDGPGGGGRLQLAVGATAGVKEEICTPDWSKSLEQIGKNAFGYRTNFFLNASPDLSGGKTIVVKLDGQQLDEVDVLGSLIWHYDPINNSVNFEPLFVPEPGKTLTLTYFVACLP